MESEKEEEVVMDKLDGHDRPVKESVAGAVRTMRARRPAIRANGVFKHPTTWEQDEIDFIVDCLKQHIPVYTIANMVHCERHCLGRLIEKTPYLKELMENKYEDMLEELEYQFDKAVKAGNTALIIHGLNTLGRRRGGVWSTGEMDSGGGEDDGRIVMGLIPQEEVDAAEAANQKLKEADGKGAATPATDPMQMAIMEEAVKSEVERRKDELKPEAIEADAVSPPPYGGGDITDIANQEEYDGYGTISGYGRGQDPNDPWAAGADSMFNQ